jgi:hypothetical protein
MGKPEIKEKSVLSVRELKLILKNPDDNDFLSSEESVIFGLDLNLFSDISLDAAELLIKSQSKLDEKFGIKKLLLNGLVNLSNELAINLNQWVGEIRLNGLKSISTDAALSLSKNHNGSIFLNGIIDLSGDVSSALIHNTGTLNFEGLLTLSTDVLSSFSKFKHGLNLNGLTHLTDNEAKLLIKNKNSPYPLGLELNGLTVLTLPTAIELAKYPGSLHLDGITNLKDDIAEALSKSRQMLFLNGLEKLSKKAKEHLLKKPQGTVSPDLQWF